MKLKYYLLLSLLFLFLTNNLYSQVGKAFTPRLTGGSIKIKGDVVFVGNSILGKVDANTIDNLPALDANGIPVNLSTLTTEANANYDGILNNNNFDMEYIDVDNDATTFSSSKASLAIVNSCKRIAYAGLYWTSVYPNDRATNKNEKWIGTQRKTDWNQIKFKIPGAVSYLDIVADTNADTTGDEDDIIFDGYNYTDLTQSFDLSPIVCYKNVTSLLQSLPEANGEYTVANLRATQGARIGASCGGWTLVIIYESPNLPSRFISTFDGYIGVLANNPASQIVDIPVTGFKTLPAPLPVRANIGVGALEGDNNFKRDSFKIKANSTPSTYSYIANTLNPQGATQDDDNFFNSTITNNNVAITNRVPNGSNTLGFDLDIVTLNNPTNTVLPNNETGATLRLTTGGDGYGAFLTSFSVEIIEPQILLTKTVSSATNVNIPTGTVLALNQIINYVIGFQNQGNDNAQNFTIKDILPINIVFNPADLILPVGVTYVYNPVTREIIFTIPNNLVEINDVRQEIIIKVQVESDCNKFEVACSNLIKNQAFATYRGELNTAIISDDPSIASYDACNLDPASTTNFLVDITPCTFTKNVALCGTNVVLTAPAGFDGFSWQLNPSPTVIGTGATYTATAAGVYTVTCTSSIGCLPITQTVTVTSFGSSVVNPVIAVADQVVTCLKDGSQFPYIFLCGTTDEQAITTNISNVLNISWQKLNEASCAATVFADCPNDNIACTWVTQPLGTSANFTVKNAGQYRIVINYQNGCQTIFYFNVYQNLLTPVVTPTNIICTTPGKITITGVPGGYEYALSNAGPWQTSNIFTTNTLTSTPFVAGLYTVYIRQVGAPVNSCLFTIPNVTIVKKDITVSTVVTQPSCSGGKGSIKLQTVGVGPQYFYSISGPASNSVGPILASDYTFNNLNAGTYNYTVSNSDGCTSTGTFTIIVPAVLSATTGITKPLTCTDGEITIYPLGGTAPYSYFVNSTTVFQTTPTINVSAAGTFNIKVVDANGCSVDVSRVITKIPIPVYTISATNILCYGEAVGAINFNVTNANGNTLEFSIDNGVTYSTATNYQNLVAGDYKVIVKYTFGGSICYIPMIVKTITQPSFGLTASGGVSELAGCGPGGTGKIRITNPQGGTAPYTYSFDNGATYGSTIDKVVPPGSYILKIKDDKGCVFTMPVVVLEAQPSSPTITLGNPSFNCSGTSTNTITVTNNGGSFTYEYLLDDVLNTNTVNPNVFLNVPCGAHTIKVRYKSLNIPTFSNLLYETFGTGANTFSPGIAAAYCNNLQPYPATTGCGNSAPAGFTSAAFCGTYTLEDNQYDVTSRIVPNNCNWFPYRDHTTLGVDPNGRFLAVNIGSAAGLWGVLYSKQINNIIPNQPVKIDIYLANLLKKGVGGADPDFKFELVDSAGVVVATQSTVDIDNIVDDWQLKNITLNPGNNTSLKFNILSGSVVNGGNDAAIDDINVYQLPQVCVTEIPFPVTIPCNQAFAAQLISSTNVTCFGANNGSVTIAAQNFATTGFQYSTNNGTTWTTSTVSPVTSPLNIPAGTANVIVRYNSTAVGCSFPFTQVITQPAILVPNATFVNATCVTGGIITGSATGGTPAYQYQLITTATTQVIVRPYQASTIFNNVPTGNYFLVVKDANGCISTTTIPIVINAALPPTAVINTSTFCYNPALLPSLTVVASNGVPPYQYSINGSAYSNDNVFAGLVSGNYIISVRDSQGCVTVLPSQTISTTLAVALTTTKILDCTTSPNAIISGIMSGGFPNFSFQVSYNGGAYTPASNINCLPGSSTFTYSATTAGTYKFLITDCKGCTITASVIIDPTVPVTVNAVATPATCGNNNGTVTITPLTGAGPFSYIFDGVASTVNVFSSLAGGSHSYTVTDSKSCSVSGTINVLQPSVITGLAVNTVLYTCTSTGTIEFQSVSGGTSPYKYSIGGVFVSNPIFAGLANGVYLGKIQDANGCIFSTNIITIDGLNPPTGMSFTSSAITCPTLKSVVTITPTGTNTPFTYQITAPASATSIAPVGNTFTLDAGTYTFQIKDSKNCTYSESYTIAPLAPLSVAGTLVNNVRCFGTATGNGTFTVGNSTNYTYTINAGTPISGTTPTIGLTNQPAGSYVIIVTDVATTCTATATITIAQPTVVLSATTTVSPKTCIGTGSVVVNAVGGWGGYSYILTSPSNVIAASQTSNTFTALTEIGTYTVKITDSNGCEITTTFGLTTPSAPTAVIDATSDFCYDGVNQATIVVTASGGQLPYSYSINGGPFVSSNTFANLTPGIKNIIVKDDFGCTVTLPAQTIAPQLLITTTLTKDLDCTASPNAVITGTITGGYAPFEYQINGTGAFTAVVGNTFTTSAATAGAVTINIKDAKNCTTVSNTTTVSILVAVTASATSTPATCGNNNGTVTITALTGQAPFTYKLDSGVFGTSNVFSSLAGGSHTYEVKDAKNCVVTGTINVPVPSVIAGTLVKTQDYTCTTTGTIEFQAVSSGTAPYTYSIGGGFIASPIFNGLANGSYTGTVKDDNGCTFVTNAVIIDGLNPPTGMSFTSSAITCPTLASTVTITPTGTNTPYTYRITAPAGSVTAYQNNVFAGLLAGTYTFEIKDAKNCTYSESYTIAPLVPISVAGQLVANVQCFGTPTGDIKFTVANSTNYNYTIDGGASIAGTAAVITVNNLLAGNHTIVITDVATTCSATASVTISQPTAALTVTNVVTPITCFTDGSVVINAVGGWGNNSYVLTQPSLGLPITQNTNTFSGLSILGNYTATVTDFNGCAVTTTFTLVAPIAPSIALSPTSDFCYDGINDATLVVTATGGQSPYEYAINNGSGFGSYQSTNTFSSLIPGTYIIKVRDSYGCIATLGAQTIQPQLAVTNTGFKDLDCTSLPNASITVVISGGYPPYTYQVNNAGPIVAVIGNTFTYDTALAGTYQFTITDARNCKIFSNAFNVNALVPLTQTPVVVTNVVCGGSNEGAVIISPSGGFPPYQISFNGAAYNSSLTYSGLVAGTYNYIIKDAKSCVINGTATVTENPVMAYVYTKVELSCSGSALNLGQICVDNLVGGVAPYTYSLTANNGDTFPDFVTTTAVDYCFTNLDYGFYELNVVDANGCTIKYQNISIASPPSDLTIDVSVPTGTCSAGGTAVVTVIGGALVGPFYFAVYQIPYPTFPNPAYKPADIGFTDKATFTGLTPGVLYTFIVYSPITNCYFFKEATAPINNLSTVKILNIVPNNVSCAGNNDGSVSFNISNYGATATSVTYQIFNNASNTAVGLPVTATGLTGAPLVVSNYGILPPAIYYIKVTENDGTFAGCGSASAQFTITESAVALTFAATAIKNDNCNLNAGQVQATANGGSGGFTYQIFTSAAAALLPTYAVNNVAWNNFLATFTSSTSVFNVESGSYVVFVKDSFGCVKSQTVVVGLDAPPTVSAPPYAIDQCTSNGSSYLFTVTGTGTPPLEYNIGNGFQASPTFLVYAPGTYSVTVKDANGCTATTPIGGEVVIYPPLGISTSITTQPSCATNDGVITANATGGTGTYVYSINPNVGTQTGNVFSNLPVGSYIIKATNVLTGCDVSSLATVLVTPTPVTFTTTLQMVSCNGGNDGKITVNLPAINNNPAYTYQINNGTAQTSNVFSNLTAGTYNIKVTSGKNCTANADYIITQPSLPTVTGFLAPFTCATNNTVNTTTLTLTGANGTAGAYVYSINGTDYFTSNVFPVVNTGLPFTINYSVKDINNCVSTGSIAVNPILLITSAAIVKTTPIACNNTGEAVTITLVGGTGPFSYQELPSGTGQLSNVFLLTTVGDHTFKIIDIATGCSFTTNAYTVAPYNTGLATASIGTAVSCFGGTGSISLSVTGYSGTYNYKVYAGATTTAPVAIGSGNTTSNTITIAGLLAGNYTVVVTETAAPNCDLTSNVINVAGPAADLTVSLVSNINANCNSGAIVTVNAIGGTANYTYAFVATGTVPTLLNYGALATGTLDPAISLSWDVYVKDSKGCIKFITVPIVKDPLPTITLPAFATNQCDPLATSYNFTIVSSTGVAPLTYSIDGLSYQTPTTFNNLAPASYTVSVKDKNGCVANAPSPFIIYPSIGVSPAVTALPTCALNDGKITVTATGGNGIYVYTINPNPPGITLVGNVFSNVPAGSYTVTVSNAATTCSESASINLVAPIPVTFAAVPTPVSCRLGNDGTITVNLAAGNTNTPYSYSISGPIIRPAQSSNIFTGLTAGIYTVTVSSGQGCSATDNNVIVTQPAIDLAVTAGFVTATCSSTNAVGATTVTLTATGGTPNYTYKKDNLVFQASNVFVIPATNSVQNIIFYVKDANNCVAQTLPVTINPLNVITSAIIAKTTAIACNNTGEVVTITVVGGTGPFSYQELPSGTGQSSNVFTLTTVGDHTFKIIDTATGCSFTTNAYTVAPYNTGVATASIGTAVSCFGGTGSILLSVTGYSGIYDYKVYAGATTTVPVAIGSGNTTSNTITIAGLLAGNYTVVVTETAAPNCDLTSIVINVAGPAADLSIQLLSNINANCSAKAIVTVSGQDGTPGYTYAFVPTGTLPIAADYGIASTKELIYNAASPIWDVYVKDSKGCTKSLTVTIQKDALPTVSVPALATNQCDPLAVNYTFTATGTGIAPLTYSIDNISFTANNVFTVNIPNAITPYTVYVKDGNGCVVATTATAGVIVYPLLALTPTITTLPSCTVSNGVITVSGSGGSGTYTYVINPPTLGVTVVGNLMSNLPAGTFSITMTDVTTNCTKTVNNIVISAGTPVTLATPTVVNATCNGGNDGIITVNLAPQAVGVNDNPLYSYSIIFGPSLFASQASNVFSGLLSGTYTVQVTSGRNCVATQIVTVNSPNPIVVPAPVVAQFTCVAGSNTNGNATITVAPTGGSGVYAIYEFIKGGISLQTGASNTYIESNLLGGTYTIKVTDSKGCVGSSTTTITINEFSKLISASIASTIPVTCTTTETITITAVTSGAVPTTLNYNVVGISPNTYSNSNTSGVFTGLTIGNYTVTVTNPVTGCSFVTNHIINNPDTFDLLIDNYVAVKCFGASTGSADITIVDNQPTPNNEAGAFNYIIKDSAGLTIKFGTSPTAGPFTINNLKAGVYTAEVVLVGIPNCPANFNFTISQPNQLLDVVAVKTANIGCALNDNSGAISVVSSGGTAPYVINVKNQTTGFDFGIATVGLTAGTYLITATDANGCTATTNLTLITPLKITATSFSSATTVQCNGDETAYITTLNVTGGVGTNYTYILNTILPLPAKSSAPTSSNIFYDLGAGTYSISVLDGYNCISAPPLVPIVINEPLPIIANLSVKTVQTCFTQTILELEATGGTGPYTYSTDGTIYSTIPFAATTLITVPAGLNYKYFVKDANNCVTESSGIDIPVLPPLNISSITGKNITCFGAKEGEIHAIAQGGVGTVYTYNLSNTLGGAIIATNTTGDFFNQLPGDYYVNVTTIGGCTANSIKITITQPFQFIVTVTPKDVKCAGDTKNGELVIFTKNALGTVQYALSSQPSQFFTVTSNPFTVTGLSLGAQSIIVQDQLNCIQTPYTFTIGSPPQLLSSLKAVLSQAVCTGDTTGKFTINISGGTRAPIGSPSYFVSIDGGTFVPANELAGADTHEFSGLTGGDHKVNVKDINDCSYPEYTVQLTPSVFINPKLALDYECPDPVSTIFNRLIVSVDASVLGSVTYALDGVSPQAGNIFYNVAPGVHYVKVVHTNTCEKVTNNVTVIFIDPITLKLVEGGLNEIIATTSGGTGGYNYTVNGTSYGTTNQFVFLQSGPIEVVVTDREGCSDRKTIPFNFIDIIIPNVFTPNGDGYLDGWGPTNTSIYKNLVFYVFDRYGRKIATLNEGQFWDGKYDGTELPTGDYWYMIKLDGENSGREFVGNFTLYR